MFKNTFTLVFVIFGIIFSQPAQPQRLTGLIEGIVSNSATKEPIASVNVQIVGTTIGAATDIDGKFKIPNVPVGTYQVRASAIGYASYIKTDVVVAAGKQTRITVDLK